MSSIMVQPFSFRDLSEHLPAGAKPVRPFLPSSKAKAEDEPPPPPPPPSFSEEELAAAEQAAYRKGFLEGEAEGRKAAESEQAETDRKLQTAAERFFEAIGPMLAQYRGMVERMRRESVGLALAAARKAAGAALDANAAALVEETVLRACETVLHEPKIAITIHEGLADRLAERLKELTERQQSAADIVILRDPDMPPSDWRIEWYNGTMERKDEQIWQAIDKAADGVEAAALQGDAAQIEQLAAELPSETLPPENKE